MEENKNFSVLIAADKFKAYVSINPDPTRPELTIIDLVAMLKDRQVIFGLKRDVISIIISRYKQGQMIDNILVAEGIPPFPGLQPKVEYKFAISSAPAETNSGHMDYREISRILNIKKDQILAIKTKMKPPQTGIMVTGEKITFEPILDIPVNVGDNIIIEETETHIHYKAACDGALKFDNQILSIHPELEITHDVDFNTGNIHFKGDVKIGRDVLPDFVVEATGKIVIMGSAIACKLEANDSIEIHQGLVGKNKGYTKSRKSISAGFVENADLHASEDIIVHTEIIGSTLYCDGHLVMENKRARSVGSTIRAARGMVLTNAGSRFDTGTTLITGIDPQKENEYLKIKNTLDTRWNEAKELEKKYGRNALETKDFKKPIPPAIQKDLDKWEILKIQIKTILQHLKKAEEAMYDYKAVIKVKETLFPRVTIQIGKHKVVTAKEYYNVTVHYSEADQKINIT